MPNKHHELIIEWNKRYNGDGKADEPLIHDGIEFWRVGHNASHEFYAGIKGEKMYRYSFGEDDEEPYVTEITDLSGYWGHF